MKLRGAWETALEICQFIFLRKKRGSQTFRKIWIDNLSGILDGELVKSAQRPKSIGRRHDKNTKH